MDVNIAIGGKQVETTTVSKLEAALNEAADKQDVMEFDS